jgi:hypothetical protein
MKFIVRFFMKKLYLLFTALVFRLYKLFIDYKTYNGRKY